MLFAPLKRWRRLAVQSRRARVNCAQVIRKLVNEDHPYRKRVALLMDNLNAHSKASQYKNFRSANAIPTAKWPELQYTLSAANG